MIDSFTLFLTRQAPFLKRKIYLVVNLCCHIVDGAFAVLCLCVISNYAAISLRKKELAAKIFKCILCFCVLMSRPRDVKCLSMIVTFPGYT